MHYGQLSTHPSSLRFDSSWKRYQFLQIEDFWNYLFSMCRALYAPMRLLRLADQNVAAMDKVHFYVCQTDANMSHYLAKAVLDAGRCSHDETLRLMNSCSQDVNEANNGDNNNND
jgi:hypothetical protein